jgi:phage regulator Rha-like protein
MSENILSLVAKEFRVDSRLLANHLDTRHRTILENIDKYANELNSLNLLPFETESRPEGKHGGGDVRYALLSEDQCYFVLTLMRNNDKVIALKLKLVKAFRDARKQIAERDTARIEGKKVRRLETDAIKSLVDYATAKGSQSANFYYANITKMTNSVVGIEAGQRDNLDARQLQLLSVAENMVAIAIRDGLKADLDYRQIYALCKDRLQSIIAALAIK